MPLVVGVGQRTVPVSWQGNLWQKRLIGAQGRRPGLSRATRLKAGPQLGDVDPVLGQVSALPAAP